MIRTVVCTKNKCSGNRFYIESVDNRLKATCKECGSIYYFDIKKEDFIMLPSCSKCNNNIFKLFYGSKGEGLLKVGSETAILQITPTAKEFEFVDTNLNNIVKKQKRTGSI